ncbi:sulfurtransferase [Consotaella aegiceratis]|uniref:sulfurtransferase n=1 Tax=Consotaella aegiceratis TaxID=3097961 RepID=UPI002F3F83F6
MSRLIDASSLRDRLGQAGLLLVDVRGDQAWRTGTIPGAVNLNVYDYFIPQSDGAGFAELERAIAAAFAAIGATDARTVVFFEEQTGMVSPRGLWFLDYTGHDGGLVLDGGLDAWTAAGGALTPGDGAQAEIVSSPYHPPVEPMRRELIASIDDVATAGPEVDVLDVRRPTEFQGTFAHDCCARAGRIPGAKFLFYEDLLDAGRYRPAADLRRLFATAGLSPQRPVVTYCHRGARAATAYVALREAGFDDVRIFVGSWHEWAWRSDLPLAAGPAA